MCFGRARSGGTCRVEEVSPIATEVRRDSVTATFAGRREAALAGRFEPFLAPFDDIDFAAFAFKRIDLADPDERLVVFLEVFALGLVFVAINAATYTVIGWLKSRTAHVSGRRFAKYWSAVG